MLSTCAVHLIHAFLVWFELVIISTVYCSMARDESNSDETLSLKKLSLRLQSIAQIVRHENSLSGKQLCFQHVLTLHSSLQLISAGKAITCHKCGRPTQKEVARKCLSVRCPSVRAFPYTVCFALHSMHSERAKI